MLYKLIVLLLGVERSGKSAFLGRVFDKKFSPDYHVTIGLDISMHDVVETKAGGNDTIRMNVYDASGAERFKSIVMTYLKSTNIYCFAMDATKNFSEQKLYFESLFPNMNKQSAFNFIITKTDLVNASEFASFKAQAEQFMLGLNDQHKLTTKLYITSAQNLEEEEVYSTFLSDCIETVLKQNVPDLQNLFKDFSNAPALEEGDTDRANAIDVFVQEVMRSENDLNRIAALIKIAEPYINRHRYLKFDQLFGKNTHSWNECLKLARKAGLTVLMQQSQNNQSSRDILIYWRKENLFAKHRHCSVLTGAFGNTKAQHEIDLLMTRLR